MRAKNTAESKPQPRTATAPGLRLMEFLETRQKSILEREADNLNNVYLYGMGNYWVAFERSAYLLCRLFPQSGTSVIRFASFPFPVVMASVADWDLSGYPRKQVSEALSDDFRRLSAPSLCPSRYVRWHRAAVCSVS